MEIRVNLSENTFQNASYLANLNNQSLDQVIEDAVENQFTETMEILKESIKFCSDEEVLELANLKMTLQQDKRMSVLLSKNSEDKLTNVEKKELTRLMRVYEISTLRKAIGIGEALKRGLIENISDLK